MWRKLRRENEVGGEWRPPLNVVLIYQYMIYTHNLFNYIYINLYYISISYIFAKNGRLQMKELRSTAFWRTLRRRRTFCRVRPGAALQGPWFFCDANHHQISHSKMPHIQKPSKTSHSFKSISPWDPNVTTVVTRCGLVHRHLPPSVRLGLPGLKPWP